jgi:hypothetical protein
MNNFRRFIILIALTLTLIMGDFTSPVFAQPAPVPAQQVAPKIQRFQGTSKEGDFQSALLEATNKALKALSGNISDQRIEWKIIEISGSKGGILGEKSIIVTIEAQPH